MNHLLYTISATLLTGIALISCQPEQADKGNNAQYETLTVTLSNYISESRYPATLRGQQHVSVRPQIAGTLTRICIEEGAYVRAGQCLFVIDQVPYQAALRQAEAQVKSAEAEVATARMHCQSREALHRDSIVSDYDLMSAQNAMASAEATLAMAQAQQVKARQDLSYTEVRSPVNGVTGMIAYRVGDLVSSSSNPLVTVSDDRTIHAYISLSESQMLDLTEQYGSNEALIHSMPEVSLLMSNGKRFGHTGRIDAVSGTIDQATGSVQVRAAFDNPDGLLRNGGSGQLLLPTYYDSAIIIPRTATFEMQDKTFCYRIVDGLTSQTLLQVSISDDGRNCIVHQGLNVGDVIIAKGAGLVKNGTQVSIK